MTRLVRAELFKLRTTAAWWWFALATLLSTIVVLVVYGVQARALLLPLDQYISLTTHGNGDHLPPEFLARLQTEWTTGHAAITQAATLYTAGQLVGVLLACLLGIVLITGEYAQQTATTTFLLTPSRATVVTAKLITAVLVAAAAWLASTVVSVLAGAIFLHVEGYGTQLGHWSVIRAILLNLGVYAIWAVFGIGFGALIRHQLAATVSATVLYLAGVAAATSVFELNQHLPDQARLGSHRPGHRAGRRLRGHGLADQDLRPEPGSVGRRRRAPGVRVGDGRTGYRHPAAPRHRLNPA